MARITIFSKAISTSRTARRSFSPGAALYFKRLQSSRHLSFEPLEDRCMLTTFTVTSLTDATVIAPGSAPGTLRQAIYDANISNDVDIIDFAPDLSGDLKLSIANDSAIGLSAFLITSPITIQGNAAGITIKRDITAPEMRFFRVASGGDLTLDSINLSGGVTRGFQGASSQDGGSAFAGAIYNQGSLQIVASTLYNNAAIGGNAGAGGNSGTGQGGAVFNDGGNVAIRNSTLSGSSVSNGSGPVVARSFGGNIYSKNGLLNIDNSTITGGSAGSGRQIYLIGIGAGQTATAQIRSAIIAQADVDNGAYDLTATDDLGGQVVVTGSNNLIRWQNLFHLITISSADPLLGPLATNGGPTLTHALPANSPALGQGVNSFGLLNDQRGTTYARVVGTVDIGAFELQTVATPELLGDYNGNHAVDAADYVLWRKTMGADVPQYSGADGNGSSKIDEADFGVWRGHFGEPAAASSATATSAASHLILITEVAQPELPPAKHVDLPPAAMLESQNGTSSAQSNTPYHKRMCDDLTTSPVSRQAREEALLAIIAGPPERPISNAKLKSLNGEFESLYSHTHSSDLALAPDDSFRADELTVHCEPPSLSRRGYTPPLAHFGHA